MRFDTCAHFHVFPLCFALHTCVHVQRERKRFSIHVNLFRCLLFLTVVSFAWACCHCFASITLSLFGSLSCSYSITEYVLEHRQTKQCAHGYGRSEQHPDSSPPPSHLLERSLRFPTLLSNTLLPEHHETPHSFVANLCGWRIICVVICVNSLFRPPIDVVLTKVHQRRGTQNFSRTTLICESSVNSRVVASNHEMRPVHSHRHDKKNTCMWL